MMATHQLRVPPVEFVGEKKEIVKVDKPIKLHGDLEPYNTWISTLTERVNEALHPALPGKLKIYKQILFCMQVEINLT